MNGIYVHIPFCASICSYCDFPKQISKEETKEAYISYLISEINAFQDNPWIEKIESVYIGGGTPNCLSNKDLERLLQTLEPFLRLAKENTIEINPELLTLEQIQLFKKYKINRVSIGVQTFVPKLISQIRRKHTPQMVKKSIEELKKAGITNINVDMMYGLSNQSLKDVKKDVRKVLKLGVSHISYYSLILEDKTILAHQVKHNQITLPDDDLVVDMANYIMQKLKKKQFIHYEISNYAQKGYASIHNLGYWNCEEYVGFGASACGYYKNKRIQNAQSLKKYYEGSKKIELISLEEAKKEYMMLGLRKLAGIFLEDYFSRFKTYPKDDFELDRLFKLGLIEEINGFIRIKEDKIWLGNLVFEAFV